MSGKRTQMSTILDVAREAGVSPSTVTHALNGKRPVGEDTKKRILEVIERLGYVANHSASHLRSGQSKIIGCYVVDITENFANQIVRGVEKGLVGSGYSLLFASGVELGGDLQKVLKFFQEYAVDGLLICHHLTFAKGASRLLAESTIPVVSINKEIEGVCSIVPDNLAGGMQAADHLVSAGMTCPAMLAGPQDRDSSIQRVIGFRTRLSELGLAFVDGLCLNGKYDFQHGYDGVSTLLRAEPAINGIFCADDYIAAGAISSLRSMGVQVPGQVRILGFDNRDFSGFWSVPISTFEQPLQEMGMMGFGMLKSLIESPSSVLPGCIRLQSRLVARSSTLPHVAHESDYFGA